MRDLCESEGNSFVWPKMPLNCYKKNGLFFVELVEGALNQTTKNLPAPKRADIVGYTVGAGNQCLIG